MAPVPVLEVCPFCEVRNLLTVQEGDYFATKCRHCGARGPESYSPMAATKLWGVRGGEQRAAGGY